MCVARISYKTTIVKCFCSVIVRQLPGKHIQTGKNTRQCRNRWTCNSALSVSYERRVWLCVCVCVCSRAHARRLLCTEVPSAKRKCLRGSLLHDRCRFERKYGISTSRTPQLIEGSDRLLVSWLLLFAHRIARNSLHEIPQIAFDGGLGLTTASNSRYLLVQFYKTVRIAAEGLQTTKLCSMQFKINLLTFSGHVIFIISCMRA